MASLLFFTQLVLALAVARLAEFAMARANVEWARARGGIEYGRERYPFTIALWYLLYAGALTESWLRHTPFHPRLGALMIAVVIMAEGLRWWAIVTLGPRWTNRIIIIPGLPRVTSGPYRFLTHPADVAALAMGLAVPLVHSAWITALLVTVLTAVLTTVRVGIEERALTTLAEQERALV